MKTKKVRPVLVSQSKAIWPNCLWLGRISKQLRLDTSYDYLTSKNPVDDSMLPQQLILISLDPDDKIEVGNMYYESKFPDKSPLQKCNQEFEAKKATEDEFIFKVSATQDQLSPEYIKQFIEEYNKGEVKDVEIEMGNNYDDINRLIDVEFPKLTNGFVTIVKKDKSTREQAMEWWNKQERDYKMDLCIQYNDICNLYGRLPSALTGREIETIWRQWHEDFVSETMADNKKMVDFEILIALEEQMTNLSNHIPLLKDLFDNYSLFIQKLSESSSFAHKAHKELQRLNK